MAGFINRVKHEFKTGNILIKIIFINAGVFIIIGLFNVICTLFKINSIDIVDFVGVPAGLAEIGKRPWTLFSYMFVHTNLFHILFNMLMLYWFGRIFLSYFNPKNLGGLYLLGGLCGAAIYILTFNTIPYYIDMQQSVMIGASASVMAIIFAAAFYRPNVEIGLLFIGKIKIIYIAAFIFILDILALGSPQNPGGHIAHIGGAVIGYIFAKQHIKGKDITRWMNRVIDVIVNLFKPKQKQKLKVKPNANKRTADYEYNQRKNEQAADIDVILDKIKASGYSSLSSEEKKKLFDASNK